MSKAAMPAQVDPTSLATGNNIVFACWRTTTGDNPVSYPQLVAAYTVVAVAHNDRVPHISATHTATPPFAFNATVTLNIAHLRDDMAAGLMVFMAGDFRRWERDRRNSSRKQGAESKPAPEMATAEEPAAV